MGLKTKILEFLKNDKQYPTIFAIAAGLYPMLYCYSKNFSIVNSFEHLLFFVFYFIVLPIVIFNGVYMLLKTFNKRKYTLLALATFNVFTFLFLIKTITYAGPQRKITVLVIIVAVLFAVFLRKYLKRLVLLQYLLAFISLFSLLFTIYANISISNSWQQQPDDILKVQFKTKPNVYVIQPDGYTNFSELNKGYYNFDNSAFESFLIKNSFTQYPNFRSNYTTTLSSNASFFMMKHHYYNNRISDFELYNARNMVISKNPVLDIFKSNGYKTHFITETGYMLFNRPKMGYDYCNFDYSDFPYINPGISKPINISEKLEKTISANIEQPKFFFIQLLKPWHIKSKIANSSNDKTIEREVWLNNLLEANIALSKTINLIKEKDGNALIVMLSDHGGYVGFNYAGEADTMTKDRDLVHSIYSSQLSIHWPKNEKPNFDTKFKTSVNVFRLLFTYLSEDEVYLNALQPDVSYKVLRDNIPVGIYEYLNENGAITLKKYK
jgi:hypothetical protein